MFYVFVSLFYEIDFCLNLILITLAIQSKLCIQPLNVNNFLLCISTSECLFDKNMSSTSFRKGKYEKPCRISGRFFKIKYINDKKINLQEMGFDPLTNVALSNHYTTSLYLVKYFFSYYWTAIVSYLDLSTPVDKVWFYKLITDVQHRDL